MARCNTCQTAWPNPDGCVECNPDRLLEVIAELKERVDTDEDGDWCPVCSGDCDDCSTKDEEIAELREAADKYKAEAMNMASLLEARSDIKTRRDWAKFARERIEKIEDDEGPPVDPAVIQAITDQSKAGRAADAGED